MDQQQVTSIYTQWEAAKNAIDVAGMVALASALPDNAHCRCYVANCTGYYRMHRSENRVDLADGLSMVQEAKRLGTNDAALAFKIELNEAMGLNQLNSFATAEVVLEGLKRRALGVAVDSCLVSNYHLEWHVTLYATGRFAEALRSAEDSMRLAAPESYAFFLAILCMSNSLSRLGRGREALQLLDSIAPDPAKPKAKGSLLASRALASLACGLHREAISLAALAINELSALRSKGMGWRTIAELHLVLAEAYTALSRQEIAEFHRNCSVEWNGGVPVHFSNDREGTISA